MRLVLAETDVFVSPFVLPDQGPRQKDRAPVLECESRLHLGSRGLAGFDDDGGERQAGGGQLSYRLSRLKSLSLLDELALRSAHPYWSNVFSQWKADYEAGMPRPSSIVVGGSAPVDADPDNEILEQTRRARVSQATAIE